MSPSDPRDELRILRFVQVGTLVCLTACGGGGGGNSNSTGPPGTYTAQSGRAEKGPLIKGSTVTAQELSATLSPTGQQYTFQIASDLGTFSPTATFGSQYIGLFASGYYFDEVQNTVSTGTITLNGYSDITTDKVLNVNLLTTLAYQRIQNLVAQPNMTFTAARSQAENEVLTALHIPSRGSYGSFSTLDLGGSTDGDNILAAVSSIFVYANTAGSLSQLIANFQSDLATNGTITDHTTQTALSVASQAVDPLQVATNLTTKYSSLGVAFSGANLADWIDQNGIGIVSRFSFQVHHATSASSFTFPPYVAAQFAGTSVAVSGGQLSVNGVPTTSPVTIGATDVLGVSVGTAAFERGLLIIYLTSDAKNGAAVLFIQGGQSYALVPDYANTGPGAVSVYAVQPITGVFQPVAGSPFPAGLQPFSVNVDPTGRFAYVPNGNSNNISAFAIDPATGSLSAISGSPFAAGTEPISIGLTPSGHFAYAANWGAGTVSGYSIDQATGVLTPLAGSPFTIANPYCVTIEPSGRFAYFPDNDNHVSAYSIDSTTGALTAIPGSPFTVFGVPGNPLAASSNPRCVAVNPSGTFAYTPNTGAGTVSGFSIDPASGVLTPTVGSPYPIGIGTGPSWMAFTPNGAYAYVANDLGNNVSAFSIDPATGALTPIAGSPYAAGTEPTSLSVDPTGKFVYAVNTADNSVSGYSINSTTGALTPLVGSPYRTGAYPFAVAITQIP
jgi:6-phosphogluconolactonase